MPYHEALLYIHILIALMLFALGIPALIVETSADDQIRHLLHKRLPYGLVTVLMVITVMVIFGLLVVAEPEAAHTAPTGVDEAAAKKAETDRRNVRRRSIVNDGGVVKGEGQPSTVVSGTSQSKPLDRAKLGANGAVAPTVLLGKTESAVVKRPSETQKRRGILLTVDGAAKSMVAILVVAFSALWWRMMKHDVRTQLVHVLSRQIISRYSIRGDFADDDIRDLVALGAHAAAGHEKRKVVAALGKICNAIQRARWYGGAELAELLNGCKVIYAAPAKRGDDDNFIEILEVLREVWKRLEELGLRHESDARATLDIVCWLGEHALNAGSASAASHTLDVISDRLEVPFRIGKVALQKGQFGVAVACLNHLEALAESASGMPKELVALIACFHAAGASATRRSNMTGGAIEWSTIRGAAIEYYDIGDFETADLLHKFAARQFVASRPTGSRAMFAPWIPAIVAVGGLVARQLLRAWWKAR